MDEKKIKCSSIEIGSDSDEETKWTPLPRPNTEALIHQLPHSPLLTTEELLAPSSDEEEGDGVEVKRKRESGPMDALQKEMTLKRERESIASGIVSDPCSLRDRSTPAATSSVGQVSLTAEIKDRQTKSACSVSEFIKGLKTTPQASTDSREIPTNDAEGMHIRDVIDLTDTSPKKQANPCSSSHQSAPNNHTSSASASLSPSLPAHPTSSSADQYQLQDEEEDDFDVLCLSVDWSTIDDFSDPEPPAASEPSNTATVASHSTSISNTTAAIHSSYTSSKGKYRAGYSEMPVKNHVSGAKRPSNIDNSLRSKRARFEDSEKELCPFSSHGSTDAGPSCAQQQRSSLSVPQRVPHGTSESLSSSVHPTTAVTEGRQWRTPNSGPTPAPRGTSGAGVVEPQAGPAGGGGRGRVTPLGSQLTTENCPMCNTRFPSWCVLCVYIPYFYIDELNHFSLCV